MNKLLTISIFLLACFSVNGQIADLYFYETNKVDTFFTNGKNYENAEHIYFYYISSNDTTEIVRAKGSDPCMATVERQAKIHKHGVVRIDCPNYNRRYISNHFTLSSTNNEQIILSIKRTVIDISELSKDEIAHRFRSSIKTLEKWNGNRIPISDGNLQHGDSIFNGLVPVGFKPELLFTYDTTKYIDQRKLMQAIQFLESLTDIESELRFTPRQTLIDRCYQSNPTGSYQKGGENGQWPNTVNCEETNNPNYGGKFRSPRIQSPFVLHLSGSYNDFVKMVAKWKEWGEQNIFTE
jgi:hypothetical protein